jgi:hypothetical protein
VQVRHFSDKIEEAAKKDYKINKGDRIAGVLTFGASLTGAAISISSFSKNFGNNLIYHVGGLASGIIYVAADNYMKRKINQLKKDHKYYEYGLNKDKFSEDMYYEEHKDFKIIENAYEIGRPLLSAALPPFGFLSAPIFLYTSLVLDRKKYNTIKKSFEIGDQIDTMIENESTEQDINSYLDGLINA